MVYPIEKMSKSSQDLAKSYLTSRGWGINIWSIPGVNGVGIMRGAIHVTTAYYDPAQDQIPNQLGADTSFESLPIVVENTGPLEVLEAPQYSHSYQSNTNTVQGGVKLASAKGEWGTCFGVLQGSDGKYAVTSSHVIGGSNKGQCKVNGQVVGSTKIDVRHCGGSSHLDAAACLLNSNVQSSPSVISLNRKQVTPLGFKKAAVGMDIITYGQNTKGSTQKVHSINYSTREDTGGNCSTSFSDLWLGSVRSKPGDSGSSMLSTDNFYVGILTSNQGNYSWNCSAWYVPQEMGLNIPGEGNSSNTNPQRQQAQRSRMSKAYLGQLTIA